MSSMTEEAKKPRVKTTFEVEERVKRALNIAASGTGKSVGELIAGMLAQTYPESLRMADELMSKGEPEPVTRRPPKPRER